MILQVVAMSMLLAGDAPVQGPSLLEARMLGKGRPSLLVPVAMITGGVSVSIGGTAAALVGMMFANIKASCAPGGRCGGYQGLAALLWRSPA